VATDNTPMGDLILESLAEARRNIQDESSIRGGLYYALEAIMKALELIEKELERTNESINLIQEDLYGDEDEDEDEDEDND
jgi:hypothetical protein